jgi:hypothetical protein
VLHVGPVEAQRPIEVGNTRYGLEQEMNSSRIVGSSNYEEEDQSHVPSSVSLFLTESPSVQATTLWKPRCNKPGIYYTSISLTQHKNLTETEAKTAKRKPTVFMVDDDSRGLV